MDHPEKLQLTLGKEFKCVLMINWLVECEPDLTKWPLWAVFTEGE
tara:strand:- start:1432 stop:1566 length:135 start_codon:yes stop_codon:yes gene_type:complete